jgi:arginyl-tRNA synthetase
MLSVSPKTVLINALSLSVSSEFSRIVELTSHPVVMTAEQIPVQRVKRCSDWRYDSAIALRLSSILGEAPRGIAERIVARCQQCQVNVTVLEGLQHQHAEFLKVLQFFSTPSGWVISQWTDQGIGQWLNYLLLSNFPVLCSSPIAHPLDVSTYHASGDIFRIQYTHARCCALLRLAEDAGLLGSAAIRPGPSIQKGDRPSSSLGLGWEPLPWLQPDQTLRCQHPAERKLMACYADLLDTVLDGCLTVAAVMQRAIALTDCVQHFQAECAMIQTLKPAPVAQTQTRLGLVQIAQRLLQAVLNAINVPAPTIL